MHCVASLRFAAFAADCQEVNSSVQGTLLDSHTPNECIVIALFNTRDRWCLKSQSSASARCASLCCVIYSHTHLDSTVWRSVFQFEWNALVFFPFYFFFVIHSSEWMLTQWGSFERDTRLRADKMLLAIHCKEYCVAADNRKWQHVLCPVIRVW